MFAGNPDTVVRQIKEFRAGGRGGPRHHDDAPGSDDHEEADEELHLLRKEVLPQLQDLQPLDETASGRGRRKERGAMTSPAGGMMQEGAALLPPPDCGGRLGWGL